MRLSAREGDSDSKTAYARKMLTELQGKEWDTPEEFNELFPKFDSDVRYAIPKLIKTGPLNTPDSHRILNMANLINYIGPNFDLNMQASVRQLIKRTFPKIDKNQKYEFIMDIIEIWVNLKGRESKLLEIVASEVGGQPILDFLKNYKKFTSLEHFMRGMLYCRARMDEANMKDTDYEYLEATLQLIMCIRTRNFSANNKDIEDAWWDATQKLIESAEKKAEKDNVQPNIRKEWLTIPEEYKFGAGEVLNYAFERAPQYKMTLFIALMKIFMI